MSKNYKTIILGVAVPLIVLTSAWGYLFYYHLCKGSKIEDVGSIFNIFSVLVSAWGVVGLVYTLVQQQNQFKEIQQQSDVVDFEKKFFQLLELHRAIKGELIAKQNPVHNGVKDQFYYAINNFGQNRGSISDVNEAYHMTYTKYVSVLSHYYRNLYYIYYYIDKHNSIADKDKLNSIADKLIDIQYYSGLFRSQLTQDELLLIALNGLHSSSEGPTVDGKKYKGLKEYIREYQIIKNINKDDARYKDYFTFLENEYDFLK